MGAAESVDILYARAPARVDARLQFRDFPDLFLVLLTLELPNGHRYQRLVLRTERNVLEQPLDRSIPADPDDCVERRIWCADQCCLLLVGAPRSGSAGGGGGDTTTTTTTDQHMGMFIVSDSASGPGAADQSDIGRAVPLRHCQTVPDWLQVVEVARSPPLRPDRRHLQDWPPPAAGPVGAPAAPEDSVVAPLLMMRLRHRMARVRALEQRYQDPIRQDWAEATAARDGS